MAKIAKPVKKLIYAKKEPSVIYNNPAVYIDADGTRKKVGSMSIVKSHLAWNAKNWAQPATKVLTNNKGIVVVLNRIGGGAFDTGLSFDNGVNFSASPPIPSGWDGLSGGQREGGYCEKTGKFWLIDFAIARIGAYIPMDPVPPHTGDSWYGYDIVARFMTITDDGQWKKYQWDPV